VEIIIAAVIGAVGSVAAAWIGRGRGRGRGRGGGGGGGGGKDEGQPSG
jgi:hypothetical protein